ncbi:MAG: response regulator [Planctomycetes bacterium]|nr:response regulator [Planctomycetota bacterium]
MSGPREHVYRVVQLMPDATLLVDLDGSIAHWNRLAEVLLGRTDTELRERTLADCAPPDRNDLPKLIERSAGSTAWLPAAFVVQRPDGSKVRCRAWGARADDHGIFLRLAQRSDDASLTRFRQLNEKLAELALEVARRRRAESMLAYEKQTLEAVASGIALEKALERLALGVEGFAAPGMRASILLLDRETGCLRHGAAPSLPDFYNEAIDGLRIGPDVGSCGTAAFTSSTVVVTDIQTDPRWRAFRELAARADLRACWSTPVLDDDGKVLGTFALYYAEPRSPSDEELALVANAAHVAGVAITRTHRQAERARWLRTARESQQAAERASAAKDRFIAMLGHELRNPLSAIMTAAQTLSASRSTEVSRDDLHAVLLRQSRNLQRILDDLLDVTRIDAGKLTLQREELRLDELAKSCVADARGVARDLTLDVDVAPVRIDADPTRLEQILRNLIDNAIKYVEPGGTIRVEVSQRGGDAVIVVADDGIGIEPELQQAVFEPFTQAPQALVRSRGGVGLGLPLVKQLVELHGGSIELTSPGIGQGTRIEVRLPALDEHREQPTTAAPPDEPAAATSLVLVVEDHDDSRNSLAALLQLWGYTVEVATNGKDGLEMALRLRPATALVDIGLPELDGYQVARSIRAQEGEHKMQLVAMSGYGAPADKRESKDAGFDLHMVKPVSVDALRSALAER